MKRLLRILPVALFFFGLAACGGGGGGGGCGETQDTNKEDTK